VFFDEIIMSLVLNKKTRGVYMSLHKKETERLGANAGIAIGPILFIIAILAILASAIASGSGSFTAGAAAEGNKTRASALIQIGENLRMGMDQIILSGGRSIDEVVINSANTSNNVDLFSPTGGGISVPSRTHANNPQIDIWYFPRGPVKGLGSLYGKEVLAVLPVSRGVCAELNNRSLGIAAIPGNLPLGNFVAANVDNAVTGMTDWPSENSEWFPGVSTVAWNEDPVQEGGDGKKPSLVGVATGCVQTSDVNIDMRDGPTSNFFYYQVLAIQ